MDLSQSAQGRRLSGVADAFFHRYLLPHNAAWHQSVAEGVYPPPFLEDLKALAQDEGLWNLFLPRLLPHEPGTRLSNLDYAPIAELLGRLPWASEVFNCSAPDTGNMELLHRFGSDAQKAQWLQPLLAGTVRSAFAMSEPDVASSDPDEFANRGRCGWRDPGAQWSQMVYHRSGASALPSADCDVPSCGL